MNFYTQSKRRCGFPSKPEIPPGQVQYSRPIVMQERAFHQLSTLPDDPKSPFLHTTHARMRTVEQTPEDKMMRRIKHLEHVRDIPELLYEMHRSGCHILFHLRTSADFDLPGRELVYLEEQPTPLAKKIPFFLLDRFQTGLKASPNTKTFEKSLFARRRTPLEKTKLKLNLNPVSISGDLCPPWLTLFFDRTPLTRINLDNPETYWNIQHHLVQDRIRQWKLYLLVQWTRYLTPLFRDTYRFPPSPFGIRPLTRAQHQLRLSSRVWRQDAGNQYVRHFGNLLQKDRCEKMAATIKNVFIDLVESSQLEAATKNEAVKKLTTMKIHVGWTQKSSCTSTVLSSEPFDVFYLRGAAWQFQHVLDQASRPTPMDPWRILGYHEANACYLSECNACYIPAALLPSPHHRPSYASFGRIVAHEMAHAFDSQGRHVDSHGRIRNWWTSRDNSMFHTYLKNVINLYQSSSPVDGRLTLDENIADLIALRVSFDAFERHFPHTNTHMFFSEWVISQISYILPQYKMYALKHDCHAPAETRTNVPLSVFDPFDVNVIIDHPNCCLFTTLP
jgi:predicted metalloendopeptidase